MDMAENKNEEKFISLYKAFVDEIYQYIFLRTGLDASLAEDITQDVFLDVFKSLNGFRELCSIRTWIFKIAKNKLFDFYRKQYSLKKIELVYIDEPPAGGMSAPEQDIEEFIESILENEIVCDCLSRIPRHYRIVLILKYVDEKSVRQIAEIIRKSPKAVESMLQRAKNAFIREYQSLQKKEEF